MTTRSTPTELQFTDKTKSRMRTHSCGQLTAKDAQATVQLCGWVHSRRDHGGVIFIDLRDRYGLTQIVFNPEHDKEAHAYADGLRREDCIQVQGIVKNRAAGMVNPKLHTGEIEVFVNTLHIFSKATTPPIEVDDNRVANEDLRLKYRYLDLRRPVMQQNLRAVHRFITEARSYLNTYGFTEIETPLLVKSTPEGARDYVVPSRVNPSKFYALPQSPQLYKQILMNSGCDRYYQIAKCLRDEDLRADRQPEHMQIDFEMSFVEQEDIRELVEGMIATVFKNAFGITIETPFRVLSYKEAKEKYASDKPDLRYGLELSDVSELVKTCDFSVFKDVVAKGGVVKALNPPADFGRKELDGYIAFAQQHGAKGLAWMRVTKEKELESNIAKYFSDEVKKQLIAAINPQPESVLMFIADEEKAAYPVLDKLRRKLASDLKLYKEDSFAFCWVNDFPLFAWNEDEQRWEPEHHMFSMPKKEYLDTMEKNPGEVLGDLWDLVLNGWEMASGSIRVSQPEVQQRIMKIIGMSEAEAKEKFGFLLESYKYGSPVHGGMGVGIARFLALLLGYEDIREVIPFPKNKHAQCPMDDCPSTLSEAQLRELHLKIALPK